MGCVYLISNNEISLQTNYDNPEKISLFNNIFLPEFFKLSGEILAKELSNAFFCLENVGKFVCFFAKREGRSVVQIANVSREGS